MSPILRNYRFMMLCALLAACATPQPPDAPQGHLHAGAVAPVPALIPDIVETTPALESGQEEARYSLTVHGVATRDLLFALARDAGIDIAIDPAIEGSVSLNVLGQPLGVLLRRIAEQAGLRYEHAGHGLRVLPDTPYLQHYTLDYVNLARNVSGSIANSMLLSGNTGNTAGTPGNTSSIRIENTTQHRFWENVERNLQALLAEKATPPAVDEQKSAKSPAANQRLIVNPESGLISVLASERQQLQVQALLDRIAAAARRQVLIEATVVEVALNEGHEQGIDWNSLVDGGLFEYAGNALKTPANLRYNKNDDPRALISLLARYGSTRVLSSPRLSVLNNQTALLKVVESYVYFTVKADTTSTANVGTTVTYTTMPQTVSVGLVMGVTAQISATDEIILNVRPTITSIGREVADPNPDLRRNGIENLVPMIRTREIESVMRINSGQTAVLGGLMEDRADYRTTRPPLIGEIPLAGELFNNRNNQAQKTELVIFLRPLVVNAPSLTGDYAHLANKLPRPDFFAPPRTAQPFANYPEALQP